jgi:hypothetical protein
MQTEYNPNAQLLWQPDLLVYHAVVFEVLKYDVQ